MKTLLGLLLFVFICNSQSSNQQQLNAFLKAFNEQDTNLMMTFVSDSITFSNIIKNKVLVFTDTKETLRTGMKSYFKRIPTVYSTFGTFISTKSIISFVESVNWKSKGILKSQKSMATYEFKNGLIYRVWYFIPE